MKELKIGEEIRIRCVEDESNEDACVKCVHQLQQALRLCRTAEIANNMKVG